MCTFLNPLSAELYNLNYHPLEVVFRYCDPQLQVGDSYSYLFDLRPNICSLNKHYVANNSDLSF